MASELDYVAMPPNVVKLIESAWQAKIKGPNGQAAWK
jgi:phosphate transport system substrate-binding protein